MREAKEKGVTMKMLNLSYMITKGVIEEAIEALINKVAAEAREIITRMQPGFPISEAEIRTIAKRNIQKLF